MKLTDEGMKLTDSKRIKLYLEFVYGECKHDTDALAYAANEACIKFEHNKAFDLFKLLCENQVIPALHTHNYGFHTATGRHIIETMKELYYEYKNK